MNLTKKFRIIYEHFIHNSQVIFLCISDIKDLSYLRTSFSRTSKQFLSGIVFKMKNHLSISMSIFFSSDTPSFRSTLYTKYGKISTHI